MRFYWAVLLVSPRSKLRDFDTQCHQSQFYLGLFFRKGNDNWYLCHVSLKDILFIVTPLKFLKSWLIASFIYLALIKMLEYLTPETSSSCSCALTRSSTIFSDLLFAAVSCSSILFLASSRTLSSSLSSFKGNYIFLVSNIKVSFMLSSRKQCILGHRNL